VAECREESVSIRQLPPGNVEAGIVVEHPELPWDVADQFTAVRVARGASRPIGASECSNSMTVALFVVKKHRKEELALWTWCCATSLLWHRIDGEFVLGRESSDPCDRSLIGQHIRIEGMSIDRAPRRMSRDCRLAMLNSMPSSCPVCRKRPTCGLKCLLFHSSWLRRKSGRSSTSIAEEAWTWWRVQAASASQVE
jgi:hypothetical protein